jgi:hypothetical protein
MVSRAELQTSFYEELGKSDRVGGGEELTKKRVSLQ